MQKGGKKVENITTVGQLRDALLSWHPDTKIQDTFEQEITVQEWLNYDSGKLEMVEVSGND